MNKSSCAVHTLRLVLAAPVLASPAFAQSTITLDSFDLRRAPTTSAAPVPEAVPTGPASCLFSPEGCSDDQASGRVFSLDDVINLGIVNRREVKVAETTDPAQAARMAAPLPSIDLEVLFEYGSDQLSGDQFGDLYTLARELRDVDFTGRRLVLMGHTDAAGSATFNRDLSLRRAATVAEFLSRETGIPRDRIRTAGMGFDYLKYPSEPLNGANRRVQILLVEG
jgi:outer membrane protein OmpA-like peptidoglycan-associated protein